MSHPRQRDHRGEEVTVIAPDGKAEESFAVRVVL
jgi:hypothetical protein